MLFLRWVVPEIHVVGEEGEVQWVEAQVPDVTEEKRKRFYELAGSAWWDAGQAMHCCHKPNLGGETLHHSVKTI